MSTLGVWDEIGVKVLGGWRWGGNDVGSEFNMGGSHDYLRTFLDQYTKSSEDAIFENAAGNFWRFNLSRIALMIEHGAKLRHCVKFIKWYFQVFFLSCFVSYRLHSQKLPISVLGIQSRTLENQSLFHVSKISEGRIIPVQKTPLETKSLDPKSRTIRSLGASRFLRPCKNHILAKT